MRQLRLSLLLGLLLPLASSAQSVRFQSQAISTRGAGIANATVAVCTQPSVTTTQPCSPLATLATSTTTTSGGANPLTADSFGNFFFYAAPGRYTVQIYGPAVSGQFVVPDVEVGSTAGGAASNFASINNMRLWDGIKYPYNDAGFRNAISDCIADAFCTGVDGRNFTATTLTGAAVALTKGMDIWLGPATLTCNQGCFSITAAATGDVHIKGYGLTNLNNQSSSGQHTIAFAGNTTGPVYVRRVWIEGLRFSGATTMGRDIDFNLVQNSRIEHNFFDNASNSTSAVRLQKSLENRIVGNWFSGSQGFYYLDLESDGTATGGSNENYIYNNVFNGAGTGCILNADSSYNAIIFNDFATCANATDVAMNNLTSTVATPVGNIYQHNILETGASTADFFLCGGAVGFVPVNTIYDGNQFGAGSPARVDVRVNRCDQTQIQNNRMFEGSTITFITNGALATNTYIGVNAVPSGATYLTDSGSGTYGCLSRLCGQLTTANNVTNTGTLTVGGTATFTATSTVVANADVQARLNTDTFGRIQLQSSTGGLLLGPGNSATHLLLSSAAPTIAAAGCGGSAASIVVSNGTAAFKVNVGTAPTSACTLTFPAATTGWNVTCNDITTQSTSVFVQKQTGVESTTSVTITNFNDVAAATAFVASDILKCTASAD